MLFFLTIFSILSLKTRDFFGMRFGLFGANANSGMRSDQILTNESHLTF